MEFPRSLFNEYEAPTEEGYAVSRRIHKAIDPLLTQLQAEGVSMRDVGSLAISAVSLGVVEAVLLAAIKDRRAKKG